MEVNFSNKPASNLKIFTYLGLSLIWVFWIGMLIYTSWYLNDYEITKAFGDVGNHNFLATISEYLVQDGYFSLVNFMIPLVILLFESLMLYLKQYFGQNRIVQHFVRTRHVYEFSVIGIWTGIMLVLFYFYFIRDRGLGIGVNPRSLQGLVFSLVACILILATNQAMIWSLSWYVVYKLAVRPDFLKNEYWKRVVFFLFFFLFMYVFILLLKVGWQRPLLVRVRWGDQLAWLKENEPTMWANYMHQNEFHYGYYLPGSSLQLNNPNLINDSFQNLPGQWPWWKISQNGWFFTGQPLGGGVSDDTAFPSGHLATSLLILVGTWVYAFPKTKTSKYDKFWKVMAIAIGISYNVLMFLALGFTYGHWMSDMAFTFIWAAIAYFATLASTKWVLNKLFVKIHYKLMMRQAIVRKN